MTGIRQELAGDQLKAVSPFLGYLGVERIELGAGTSRVHLEVGPQHVNRGGTAHGGLLASLLDIAVGSAASSVLDSTQYVVTASLTVDYIEAGRAGERLVAEGTVLKRGARLAFADARVLNERGALLARASAVVVLHRRTRPVA